MLYTSNSLLISAAKSSNRSCNSGTPTGQKTIITNPAEYSNYLLIERWQLQVRVLYVTLYEVKFINRLHLTGPHLCIIIRLLILSQTRFLVLLRLVQLNIE